MRLGRDAASACFYGLVFDPFTFEEDSLAAPEVDIGGPEIRDAFVVARMIIVADAVSDIQYEIAGQIMFPEQDTVIGGLTAARSSVLHRSAIRGQHCSPSLQKQIFECHPRHLQREWTGSCLNQKGLSRA